MTIRRAGQVISATRELLISSAAYTLSSFLKRRRPHILLACMPKSASSFLTAAIIALPRMRHGDIYVGEPGDEPDLDRVKMMRLSGTSYVCQHHIRFTPKVARQTKQFDITPVVLTRNLFDCVVSMRDEWRKFGVLGGPPSSLSEIANLRDDQLDVFIADVIMPWYVTFFVTWSYCSGAIRVRYKDVKADPHNVIAMICEKAEIDASTADIDRAVAVALAQAPRMNKAISGRGQGINEQAKSHIRALAAHYPDVDFSEVL